MPGIYATLDIARKAMIANQLGIQVTSHNIANVNTAGYSRQRVTLEETTPVNSSPGQIGTGVAATSIQRCVDLLVDNQLVAESGIYNALDYTATVVGQVEALFNEAEGANLGDRINEFFNAWEDLATNPQGLAERQMVVSNGDLLASAFRKADQQLRNFQENANKDVVALAADINTIARQIADLNGKIKIALVGGQQPNDLMDQRAVLLRSLSEKIGFTTLTDQYGQVNVMIGNGKALVDGESAGTLAATPVLNPATGEAWNRVFLTLPNQSALGSQDITSYISSGQVQAVVDFRDNYVTSVRSRLDSLAYSISSFVNQQHAAGYGLDGSTGVDFFQAAALSGAASNFALNPALPGNLNAVAAAGSDPTAPAGSGAGDNRNASLVAGLKSLQIGILGNTTFTDFLGGVIGEVGTKAKSANQDLEHQKNIIDYLEAQREQVSGVSLDEEMTNLIKFQRAFEAATKLITAMDDLLQQVIELGTKS